MALNKDNLGTSPDFPLLMGYKNRKILEENIRIYGKNSFFDG